MPAAKGERVGGAAASGRGSVGQVRYQSLTLRATGSAEPEQTVVDTGECGRRVGDVMHRVRLR